MKPSLPGNWAAGAQTLAVTAAYCAAIWFVHTVWLAGTGITVGLRLPLAFFLVQMAALALLTGGVCVCKVVGQHRERSAACRQGAIQQMLAAYAAGDQTACMLETNWAKRPGELSPVLGELLLATKGEAHERLSRLASEAGLTAHWIAESRSSKVGDRRTAVGRLSLLKGSMILEHLREMVSDPDPAVRVAVYRALLRSGRDQDVEHVFAAVIGESLLIRALLNTELRHQATVLCRCSLPEALLGTDPERLKRVLDMVGAWKRVVALPGLGGLLNSPDPGVRRRALALLPYVVSETLAEKARTQEQLAVFAAILGSLADHDEDVSAAAAIASARLKLESAIPLLANGLRDRKHRVGLSSAVALAELGPLGLRVLEAEVLTSRGQAASVALEALERVRTGQWAG